MGRLIVVSNRVGSAKSVQTGGLATALQAALAERGGIWFGWSGKIANFDAAATLKMEAGHVSYATIDLERNDYQGYYSGYANRVLWPLFHYRPDLIEFNRDSYAAYLRVNRLFAEQIARLVQPDDVIWVHDYHLIPLAHYLRKLQVHNRIGFFLHTPLAPPALLRMLPNHEEVFRTFQFYDLIGLQQQSDLKSLQDYFIEDMGARLASNDDLLMSNGRRFAASVFGISIDADAIAKQARTAVRRYGLSRLNESLQGRAMIIGVDRLDYSKGLPDRFEAFGRLMEREASLRRRVTLLQIAPPTRSEVPEYQKLRSELEQIAGHINGLYAEPDWMPIRYVNKSFSQRLLTGFYRLARVGLVTPLRDGMNLVAKEYIASQNPEDPGVLILSRFAGAAAELDAALLVNPFDELEVAEAIVEALNMSLDERKQRWGEMMSLLQNKNIQLWTDTFIQQLLHDQPVTVDTGVPDR